MEHTRDDRCTGVRASQCLDHLPHFGCTHSFHKHLSNGAIEFISTTMVPLEQLRLIATTGPRNWQIKNRSDCRFQIARIIPITLISPLCAPFIGCCSDKRRHFFFQHTHQSCAHGLPQPLFHELFKHFLTSHECFDMLLGMSHWYPPGDLDDELFTSLGYQTLLFTHNSVYCHLFDMGLSHCKFAISKKRKVRYNQYELVYLK